MVVSVHHQQQDDVVPVAVLDPFVASTIAGMPVTRQWAGTPKHPWWPLRRHSRPFLLRRVPNRVYDACDSANSVDVVLISKGRVELAF